MVHYLSSGSSTSSELSVTITAAGSTTYILTIVSASGGSTTPSAGTYTRNNNDSVSITAAPNSGNYLNNWIVNGVAAGSANPLVFNITSDTTVSPVFTTSPPQTCPSGYHWDETQNACVADTTPPNTLLIVGGIGAALVIAGIAVAASKRKKTKKP